MEFEQVSRSTLVSHLAKMFIFQINISKYFSLRSLPASTLGNFLLVWWVIINTYWTFTLLGMVSVFQENRVRIHVKFMFARKTCKLFPTQIKGKHIIIIPSVCIRKRKPVWFFVFCKNSFPFLCENRWNNCIMFSLCLRGKQSNCFPGKHELYMFSTSVFLEYRDDPQQCYHKFIT